MKSPTVSGRRSARPVSLRLTPPPSRAKRVRHGGAARQSLERPAIDPGALAPPPPPPSSVLDGLLLAAVDGQAVSIQVPWPAQALPDVDTVQLIMDGALVGGEQVLTLADETRGHAEVPLAASDRAQEKLWALAYEVHFVLGDERQRSPATPLTVDLTAPGAPFLAALEIDPDIVAGGLDRDTLAALGDKLPTPVAGYQGETGGDTLIGYVGTAQATDQITVPATPGDITLEFRGNDLRTAGTGTHEFTYRVMDRAGNLSDWARPVELLLFLEPELVGLQPLVVRGYTDLLDDTLARNVIVEIPPHSDIEEGDQVVVVWGGREQTPIPVDSILPTPLLEIAIPFAEVQHAYYGEPPTPPTPPVSTDIRYKVRRSGFRMGTAPDTPVLVDLRVPGGGPDPDPETPELELLVIPTIESASGQQNQIPVEDSDEDASATLPWYNNEAPPQEVFLEDDVVRLYWKGVQAGPSYTVTDNDVTNKQDLVLPVPVASIIAGGSGQIPARYTITRTLTPGRDVTSRSPVQLVDVVSGGDLPGGGRPLVPAVWVDTEGETPPVINLPEARDGTEIKIPAYLNIDEGDLIEISYQAVAYSDPPDPIPGATFTDSKTLADGEQNRPEIVMRIPEAPLMAVLNVVPSVGRARLDYTVTNAAGTVNGTQAEVFIDVRGEGAEAR